MRIVFIIYSLLTIEFHIYIGLLIEYARTNRYSLNINQSTKQTTSLYSEKKSTEILILSNSISTAHSYYVISSLPIGWMSNSTYFSCIPTASFIFRSVKTNSYILKLITFWPIEGGHVVFYFCVV